MKKLINNWLKERLRKWYLKNFPFTTRSTFVQVKKGKKRYNLLIIESNNEIIKITLSRHLPS